MSKVVIIAEAGVNHNGDMSRAKQMIDVAAEAGADYVKFQSFKADKLVSPQAKKADYQLRNMTDQDDNQFNMLKQLELSHEDHLILMDYCRQQNIKFLSTAFDAKGVSYLDELGLDLLKSPSGEITNYPYLKALAHTGKPVVLSSGMAELEEIEASLKVLEIFGMVRNQVTVLHCNTEYPTPMEDVNLKAMNSIGRELGVMVGYSDHTLGIEVPVAAVAIGATIIEKHFTLNRELPGPDHKASLEPCELKSMVDAIRNVELAVSGDGLKRASASEEKNKVIARKSLHLSTKVKAGQKIDERNIVPLRPGDGISPMHWEDLLKKKAVRDLPVYHKLTWDDLI
ncbi:N-acetylneuraminate synthase [Verrucomicrobia bacterium]|nr:N-acetylneuraminate synthase [Verrucomicrobiota bacterium]